MADGETRRGGREPRATRGPFEVVVDGTDGAGKTSCVEFLIHRIRERGLSVATYAPYREVEVYPLWDTQPEEAACTVVEVMDRFRGGHRNVDVLVWDRGWPTAYVSTDDARARARFAPLPPLTLLLLSTRARTEQRARDKPGAGVWMRDPVLVHRFNAAYHQLRVEALPGSVLRFHPQERAMFDFDRIGGAVDRALDALGGA